MSPTSTSSFPQPVTRPVVVAALLLALGTGAAAGADELPVSPDLGREASEAVVQQMDISIAPDGATLPAGSGTVEAGESVYQAQCLVCHGAQGDGADADMLTGGVGTLATAQPVKTVGSYWPYATTLFDYIRRAMPHNAPLTLTDDEVYAVTAYLLWTNRIIGRDLVLDATTLPAVQMPNRQGFVDVWGPPWKRVWHTSGLSVLAVVLLIGAVVATIVLADPLTRRPRLYRVVRGGLLAATLIGLGGWFGVQPGLQEIVDAVLSATAAGDWRPLLGIPALVLVAVFTLVALLLWGRGAFCGWLCPFGALQDFIHRAARLLGVPRYEPPARVHRSLRFLKYAVLAAIVTVAVFAPAMLDTALAAEPFGTAIGDAFLRPWPYVVWAVACLAIAVFTERAFCRYLCPFGAALGLGGRLRMLDWLRRHRACGSSCTKCEPICPTRAIRADGTIDHSECIQCLRCQEAYFDPAFCPEAKPARTPARATAGGTGAAAALVATLLITADPAGADMYDPLATRLTPGVIAKTFPGASDVQRPDGSPPVATVLEGDAVQGWLFSTFETVNPRGYSGEPFDIIVGLDHAGRITGSAVLELHEPMVGPSLIPQTKLEDLFEGLRNLDVRRPVRFTGRGVDGVRGATISATLTYNAIVLSARKMARIQGLLGEDENTGPFQLDVDRFEPRSWQELLDWGGVGGGEYSAQDLGIGGEGDEPGETVLSLYAALATPADVGRNLFGGQWFNHHISQIGYGDQLLAVLGSGRISWRGNAVRRTGQYDRLRLVQGEQSFSFTKSESLTATAVRADGRPLFSETGLFRIPRKWEFDPLEPWTLELRVPPDQGGGAVDVGYSLPQELIGGDPIALEDAGLRPVQTAYFGLVRTSALDGWRRVWAEHDGAIMGLVLLLMVLSVLVARPNVISRHRRVHQWVRLAFLVVVIGWLGWVANAQLTIVNVLTYAQAVFTGGWTSFLYEPLIVIIAGYTLVSLVLFGRGVFCGWLCPFGALQELLARLARAVRLPTLAIAETANERLWALKYVVLAVLVGSALTLGMGTTQTVAEVEPFKTAITLRFDRSLPYVMYAGVLLALGLFVERFYCRFLCPLGAAVAVLGKVRIFGNLARRVECGNPCRLCERACPVQAIPASGVINMNECFQCLDCQVEYHDDRRCPPLAQMRRSLAPGSFAK